MMEHLENLLIPLGFDDQEVRRSSLSCLRLVLEDAQPTENKAQHAKWFIRKKNELPRSKPTVKAPEIAQIIWEGLVSLQILLEEVSVMNAIIRTIQEVLCPVLSCFACHTMAMWPGLG